MPLGSNVSAYAAGLFDGEGSVSARRAHRSHNSFAVTAAVDMCEREPLDFLAQHFGGRVVTHKRKTRSGKPIFGWRLHCQKAAQFLEAILPYLIIKRERAVHAIELARLAVPRPHRWIVLTDEQIAQRQIRVDAIRAANFSSNGRIGHAAG